MALSCCAFKAENTKPLLGSEESVMAGDYVEVSQNESFIVVNYIHGEEEKKDNLDKTSTGTHLAAVHYQSQLEAFITLCKLLVVVECKAAQLL